MEQAGSNAALAPFGRALLACYRGDAAATLLIRRDDGFASPLPLRHFFRPPEEFTAIERMALERACGRVLDVGAGAGIHSLVLQERGLEVDAVDVTPAAAEIMRGRGVQRVWCTDVHSIRGRRFDTLLLLGHAVGMAGDLAGLDRLLTHARSLLGPGGQVLLDSLDVRADASHHAYHEANRKAGRYVGEITMQFEYAGEAGPFCQWLQVDAATLAIHGAPAGFTCEVLLQGEWGEYLARLAC